MIVPDHRLLLWRLIQARTPGEITQLEALAGTTQRAAVDTRLSDPACVTAFPGFAGGRGTPAARQAAARRFSKRAILYLAAGSSLTTDDAPGI